jgi:hypothetical protein
VSVTAGDCATEKPVWNTSKTPTNRAYIFVFIVNHPFSGRCSSPDTMQRTTNLSEGSNRLSSNCANQPVGNRKSHKSFFYVRKSTASGLPAYCRRGSQKKYTCSRPRWGIELADKAVATSQNVAQEFACRGVIAGDTPFAAIAGG